MYASDTRPRRRQLTDEPLDTSHWPSLDDFGRSLPRFEREEPLCADHLIYRRLKRPPIVLALPLALLAWFAAARYPPGELLAVLVPSFLFVIPLHEGVHWLAARLGGVPARHCRIAFDTKNRLPYFRSMIPMPVTWQRIVLLAPGVVLTVAAAIPAVWLGDLRWWLVAAIAATTGVGDYYWFWRLRGVPTDRWVWDRAGLVGLEVLRVPDE